jgi:hypothetical protein
MPFETPIPIRQAVQNVLDGKYVLPAIQREFIWEPEQIELLFDSLLRGYPISSFLFWEVPRQVSYSLSKSLKVTRPQFSDMHRMLEANQSKDLHCGPPVLATEFTTCAWGEMVLPFHVTKTRR